MALTSKKTALIIPDNLSRALYFFRSLSPRLIYHTYIHAFVYTFIALLIVWLLAVFCLFKYSNVHLFLFFLFFVSITFARESHAHGQKRYSHRMQTTTRETKREKKNGHKKQQDNKRPDKYWCIQRRIFFHLSYVLSAHFGSEQEKKVQRVNMDKAHAKSQNERQRTRCLVCIAIGIPCQILFDSLFKHK